MTVSAAVLPLLPVAGSQQTAPSGGPTPLLT